MEKRAMTKEEVAVKLTELFPEKAPALAQHYDDYDGQLLAHVFFADEVNEPLFVLLQSNCDQKTIQTYCAFIEDMYFHGDEDVKNVVEVTILERLSDEEPVWFRFGSYLTNQLIREINTVLIPQNTMLPVLPLPYRRRREKKRK